MDGEPTPHLTQLSHPDKTHRKSHLPSSECNSPRSTTELPLTEADDVISGVVPIIF